MLRCWFEDGGGAGLQGGPVPLAAGKARRQVLLQSVPKELGPAIRSGLRGSLAQGAPWVSCAGPPAVTADRCNSECGPSRFLVQRLIHGDGRRTESGWWTHHGIHR